VSGCTHLVEFGGVRDGPDALVHPGRTHAPFGATRTEHGVPPGTSVVWAVAKKDVGNRLTGEMSHRRVGRTRGRDAALSDAIASVGEGNRLP